jgi:hypothetical protein
MAPANSLFIIFPYREGGTWVFDDERAGLVREPFVEGVPEIIDKLVTGIPGAEKGFKLVFSAAPFPRAQRFDHVREEYGGNWYRAQDGAEGWLCPALFKYFPVAPPSLYARAEAK